MTTRVTGEPAYVLHHYDWSESSVIVEAFTRHHGRVALIARGAKKPSSNFRPVLLPMQALLLAWSGDAEVRALKGAEWGGGPVMPTSSRNGDALLAGYYAGELLLRLLARDDPHPRLFDGYARLMHALTGSRQAESDPPRQISEPPETSETEGVAADISADISVDVAADITADKPEGPRPARAGSRASTGHAAALRAFELLLLREAGLLPALDVATLTLAPLVADAPYRLSTEGGLLACGDPGADPETDAPALPGANWLGLEQALADASPFAALQAVIAPWTPRDRGQLRRQLRVWLHVHSGGQVFKTGQLLRDLQTL